MRVKLLRLGRALDCFSLSMVCSHTCLCGANHRHHHPAVVGDDDGFGDEDAEGVERSALIGADQMVKLREMFEGGNKTLAFHLEPKTVVLKVSMHCGGCARKVEKHIAKMEGVTSFQVDLETKKVVVVGDITPFEVLESVSKVKFAELWIQEEEMLARVAAGAALQ